MTTTDVTAEGVAACEAGDRYYLVRRRLKTARLQRLFAVACCRRPCVWDRLDDPRSVAAIEIAERYADRRASRRELSAARDAVWDVWQMKPTYATYAATYAATDAATYAAYAAYAAAAAHVAAHVAAYVAAHANANADARREEWKAQGRLLADMVVPADVVFEPSWRTEAVVGLATGIYEDRAWDRMPMLADALEDAGCYAAGVLDHCRDDGPHARGCWVVDSILAKRK